MSICKIHMKDTPKVNQAIYQYGTDKVGVYFIAFDEIATK